MSGAKRKSKVKINWSQKFAYAIGLIATDGNLSPDGRHFDFTSKDLEQINNFKYCLGISNKVSQKRSGFADTKAFRIQFGDKNFYEYLQKIGLTPNKSLTMSNIYIPKKYFFDFLRGHFDGDGTFYSYMDKRWKSSFMYYLGFVSASEKHIGWLREKINNLLNIKGSASYNLLRKAYQLKYAKGDSLNYCEKCIIREIAFVYRGNI